MNLSLHSPSPFLRRMAAWGSLVGLAWATSLSPSTVAAGAAPDLASAFDASVEDWRAQDAGAVLTWESTGGSPGGYLRGRRAGSTNAWHFVSPVAWAGDWSTFKVLKFDLSIPTRQYPDADRAGMVVIAGANGEEMTWTASTPLWTWTHYEVELSAAAFAVEQARFNGIMAQVAEVRILAEFTVATEAVGLDNVLLTATPPAAHQTDLVSRFTDGTIQGWRPVDDVTLTASQEGQPSFGLRADDWMDGRLYRIATPVAWAGDWRQYRQLSFDMRWSGSNSEGNPVELVRLFGANGQTLVWSGSITNGLWTHRRIPLTPESFGVTATELEAVLAHVSEMWIRGEFGSSDDITYLDNVRLTANTDGPPRLTQNLVSRFDAHDEGWEVFDHGAKAWVETGGISGGALRCLDQGSGTARFQTPDAWSGDWRAFRTLRFSVKPDTASYTGFPMVLWIATWDGSALRLDLPEVPGSWTPFTVDLTPETFGVSAAEFDAVMRDVACAWINADLLTGNDTTWLDNAMLLTESGPGWPPDRWCDFESGGQAWRKGGGNGAGVRWTFGGAPAHLATGGNPAGYVENTDDYEWTYWFTPESWAGDWRGLQSVSFDFKIIQGTAANLFDTRMISLISAYTNLHAHLVTLPVPGQWEHFEFALTPGLFGVSAAAFERVMRDVVALGIRSEWINGGEREGLDNVRLTKATDAYWAWMAGYFSGAALTDELIAGKLADPDGDGADNWHEFLAATNPTNRLDLLRIDGLAVSDPTVRLDFLSKTGRVYGVEFTPTLSSSNLWQTATNDVPGSGLLLSVPLPAPGGHPQQFYRLRARPAE